MLRRIAIPQSTAAPKKRGITNIPLTQSGFRGGYALYEAHPNGYGQRHPEHEQSYSPGQELYEPDQSRACAVVSEEPLSARPIL